MKSDASRISDLRWVRPLRQERSRRTLRRLLDAAEAVIAEKGFADASVADIAARAGCSVGTVYRRFRDKRALLRALDERLGEEFQATLDEAVDPARWEGAGVAEILEGYLEFSLAVGHQQAALRRAMLRESLNDAALAESQGRLNRALQERLRDVLMQRREEIRHPHSEVAVDFVLEQLRAMLLARLEREPIACDLLAVSDGTFVAEALRSVAAYLGLPATTHHATTPSAEGD